MEGQSFKVDRRGCRPGAQFRVVFRQMLFTINSRTKWKVVAAEYRKETLEKLRVGLRDHCEKSLQEFSHDLAIGGLLEFGKAAGQVRSPSSLCVTYLYSIFLQSDTLCKDAERTEAQSLHRDLIQIVEEISRDMPSLCVTLAGGSDYPITHHELNTTLALSTEQFTSRQKQAFDSVRSTLPSWLKLLN